MKETAGSVSLFYCALIFSLSRTILV